MKNNFKKKILKNGMTVLFEKREIPVVSISISVKCGGINERMEQKGISHFIEHMLYKGTATRTANDIAQEIEKNGGELNGFTAENVTSFWIKMPSKHLDIALDVLSDMIKNSKFDEEELEKERKVIFEEIKMRKDNPRYYVVDKAQSMLYSGTLGADLIGTEKTMNSITRDDLIRRFKETYTSNNLILTVVGNADFDYIVKWAEEKFSEDKMDIPSYKFENKNNSFLERRKGINQANLVFAFHSPTSGDKNVYAAEILVTLMGDGMSSRLFSEIREKRNLVYSINGDLDSNRNYSYTLFYAGTTVEKVDEVKSLILKEFKKVSRDLTEVELSQIKEQLIGNYQISMEDSQGQMMHLLSYELDSKAEDFYDYEEYISSVKLESVKELADKVKEGDYSFFVLIPEE